MKKIIISTVIFLISLIPLTLAENLSLNKDLLEEIEIMESVLNRVMGSDSGSMGFQGSNANGYYLPDYGVIFNVAYPIKNKISMWLSGFSIPDGAFTTKETDAKAMVELQNGQRLLTIKDEDKIEKKDVITGIKKSFITFFTKYASSISALKPDENITVILDFNGGSFTPSDEKDNLPQQLTATLSMADIGDFKRNKISDKELEKRIVFNEIESIDQDVSIFANIIQTTLEHMKEESGLGFHGNVKSIRIQGHGILFMVDADFGMKTFRLMSKNLEDLEENLKVMEENLKGKEEDLKSGEEGKEKIVIKGNTKVVKSYKGTPKVKTDDVKEYEEKLIKVISKYGHTLSEIKPGEYVEIALNFNGVRIDKDFSKGILKVKKSDIDDFYKGKIDYDNFQNKVNVVYY